MEDDIQNYFQTVMFRGTPCTLEYYLPNNTLVFKNEQFVNKVL